LMRVGMRMGRVVGGRFSRGGTLLDDGWMDGCTGAGSMGLYYMEFYEYG
jgi:hypothetical protein